MNKRIVLVEIAHRDLQDWDLTIEGYLDTSTRDADRVVIEGYFNGDKVNYTDGAHDGDYYIIGLDFDDNRGAHPAEHKFTLKLLQAQ